jgi:hypothetical protein
MDNLIDLTASDDEADDGAQAAVANILAPAPEIDIQALAQAAAAAAADATADTIAGAVARAAAAAIQHVADAEGEDDELADEDFEDPDDRLERLDRELRTVRAEVERLADRDEMHRHEVEMLRVQVRRANAERATARTAETARRDNAFFDAMRRRFVDSWRDNIDLILKFSPHQLLFLGHLLQLPVITASNKLE